jgi:ubiquinone/menaquinone biosynthesis C-methylase UbiE
MKVLDVGCGNVPRGDVNCEYYVSDNIHRNFSINPNRIKNFRYADIQDLPFTDQTFDVVIAHHVIEHLDNPVKAIKEMLRVAKKRVVIYVPWRDGLGVVLHRNKGHKCSFNKKWFWEFARINNLSIDVSYSESLWLPVEIKAVIFKTTVGGAQNE